MANDVEVLGIRLLRALNEEAIGDPRTAVLEEDVAQRAGFDYGSEDFDAALQYLLRCGYLKSHYSSGRGLHDHARGPREVIEAVKLAI